MPIFGEAEPREFVYEESSAPEDEEPWVFTGSKPKDEAVIENPLDGEEEVLVPVQSRRGINTEVETTSGPGTTDKNKTWRWFSRH